MPDDTASGDAPSIGMIVGTNVRSLRMKKNWTQRDLHLALESAGYTWNRVSIGQLEKSGTGGERLGDLLALADVLETSLWDLVESPSATVRGRVVPGSQWMKEVLTEPREAINDEGAVTAALREDPEVDAQFADRNGLSDSDLRALLLLSTRVKDAPEGSASSFAVLRDWVAGVTPDMDPQEARARRGHATRRFEKALKAGLNEREQSFSKVICSASKDPLASLLFRDARYTMD